MQPAPTDRSFQDLIDTQTLSRLQWLASIAREDAGQQEPLLLPDLKPKEDDPQKRPTVWLYRAVRLLPMRELLGRRLGAAVDYQAGRRVADQAPIASIEDFLQVGQELGLGTAEIVERTDDKIVVDEWGCSTCEGLQNINEKVCHFEAGFISRALEKALGRRARATETLCWVSGDDRCRFVATLGPEGSAPGTAADLCMDSAHDPVEIMAALVGTASQAMRLANELRQKNIELALLATTDPLTELLNRRALIDKLNEEIERAQRYATPLALAMVDVDEFKQVNDTYGHDVGDQVLKRIASVLNEATRTADVVARHGGEEFCVLCPHLALPKAEKVMERLRYLIETDEAEPNVTVSIGVTAAPPSPLHLDDLLSLADKAMYAAKSLGRNRVVALGG